MSRPSYLQALESEAIHIIRDGVAEAENPVILFSGGKDSTVLAYLAVKAFYPSPPPLPLLHVDSTWEFQDVLDFRDRFAARYKFKLEVYANEEGRSRGLNPIDHGGIYTTIMRTDALKQALDQGGYDVIFGGARRDEEVTRAKERIVSVRGSGHSWDPRNQRPELWSVFNWRKRRGQSLRAFPLSNWTEQDLWSYIVISELELCPLYFARERLVVDHQGQCIVLDEPHRLPHLAKLDQTRRQVRFRSLGCWPVTAASASNATDQAGVMRETLSATFSERSGRVSDEGSLESQKRAGYF